MLIIAEDFVGGTMIAHWQAGQTQTGFRQNLMRRLRRGALGALVFEALGYERSTAALAAPDIFRNVLRFILSSNLGSAFRRPRVESRSHRYFARCPCRWWPNR